MISGQVLIHSSVLYRKPSLCKRDTSSLSASLSLTHQLVSVTCSSATSLAFLRHQTCTLSRSGHRVVRSFILLSRERLKIGALVTRLWVTWLASGIPGT